MDVPNKAAIFHAIVALFTFVVYGYATVIVPKIGSMVIGQLRMTDKQSNLIGNVVYASVAAGSFLGAVMAECWGRHFSMVLVGFLGIGAPIIAILTGSFEAVFLGLFLLGCGIGMGVVVGTTYLVEIAPPRHRGFLGYLTEVFFNLGLLMGYIFVYKVDQWRIMIGFGACLSLVELGSLKIKESPRWLISQNLLLEADSSLRLSGSASSPLDARRRISRMVVASRRQITYQLAWRNVISSMGLLMFQAMVGVSLLLHYVDHVFDEAGIKSEKTQFWILFSLILWRLVFVVVGMVLGEKFGRRRMLLVGIPILFASLCLVSASFKIRSTVEHPRTLDILLFLVSYLLVFGSFSLGVGPISWVYSAEILPFGFRCHVLGSGLVINRAAEFMMVIVFGGMGKAASFLLCSIVAALSFFFSFFFVRETWDLTLEEIELQIYDHPA